MCLTLHNASYWTNPSIGLFLNPLLYRGLGDLGEIEKIYCKCVIKRLNCMIDKGLVELANNIR